MFGYNRERGLNILFDKKALNTKIKETEADRFSCEDDSGFEAELECVNGACTTKSAS